MSSAPTISPTPTGPTPPASSSAASSSSTFWCHECDMSISLPSSATAGPACPHCHSLSLEHLDHPAPLSSSFSSSSSSSSEEGSDSDLDSEEEEHRPNPNPNPNPPNPNPNPPPNPNPAAYLQLLIQHLSGDDSISPSDLHIPRPRRGPSPAPKSSIDSIPSITISDSSLLCAICKDEFMIDSEARKLPCSHVYHSDCIVPWLSSHNSCPLCRCRLPTLDGVAVAVEEGRRVPSSLVFGGRIVRGIARRQRMVMPERRRREGEEEGEGVTETQMARVEGNAGPANSGETVSSAWPVEGGDPAVVSGVRDGMGE